MAAPAKPRMEAARIREATMHSFISRASIFLPRYSGVRPTMSPATNTAMMAITSMP